MAVRVDVSPKPIMNSKAPGAECFQGSLQHTLLHSPVMATSLEIFPRPMATPLRPWRLKRLLEKLESPFPSIDELPANLATSDDFGDYFQLKYKDRLPQDKQRWQVRLRVFTAIGNCRTLRKINLACYGSGIRCVLEAEARALLEGLLSNPVLEELDVSYWDGFGTVAACEALAHILRCARSLHTLRLSEVGMTSEGLGHIAAGLEANPSSPLRILDLGRNGIGDVSGAQHLAHILATTPTLDTLRIVGILGMDVAAAEVIANALAHNTTLHVLFIGCDEINDPNESAPLTKLLLGALSDPTGSQGTPSSAAFNHSIAHLCLYAWKMALPGGAGLLGEAVAQMLRTNTTLTRLWITGNFLSHGLDALAHNTTITHLLLQECHDDVEMEMLIPIVGGSGTLEELDLHVVGNTTASFKRALFRSLEQNPSIESLVLDGWHALNDDMYRDLMHSLRVNTNLHCISCHLTSWQIEGKVAAIQQALTRNAQVMAKPLKHLLEELESLSPTIHTLPANLLTSDDFGDYFQLKYQDRLPLDKQWWQVRLRVFTAIGNCGTLTNIRLGSYNAGIRRRVQEAEARALLEGLLSNPVLQVLDVSGWDGFGTVAACEALAHMLRCTRSLHTLCLQEVGMTSEGLGLIGAALEANPSSPLCILDLARNGIGDVSGAQHLAHILATTPTLEELSIFGILGMDVAGAEVIANALAHNTTLHVLFIGCDEINHPNESAPLTELLLGALSAPTGSHGTPSSAAFNHSITNLYIPVFKMVLPGGAGLLGEAVAQMLRTNTTLTRLWITGNFLSHGLDALAHNTTITHLLLQECHDDVEMEMLIPIVGDSGTLGELDLSGLGNTTASFKRALLQSLQQNPSIESLVLDGWDGLNDDMYRDLMHSLQVNTNLHRISCHSTSWQSEGKDAAIQQALKRNAPRVAYLSLAQHADVEFTDPKHGRLFLCGSAFAGKTTLRKKLVRSSQHLITSLGSLNWAGPNRTEGIEIQVLRDDDEMHITIWDLAGQDEFRALQDHLFPSISQACVFLFVYSPYDHQTHKVKQQWEQELEKDLRNWLCFIVSNSSTEGHILPQVYVILTHLDKMIGNTCDMMVKWATPTIEKVCQEFNGVIEIVGSSQVFALDGKSFFKQGISALSKSIFNCFGELLGQKLLMVPRLCTHMGIILVQWTSRNPTRPLMRLDEFHDLCCKEVGDLRKLTKEDERAVNILQAISSYLHDVGTIMYFKDLDFLVVNPNWVTHVFLGQMIKFGDYLESSNMMMPKCKDGFVAKAHLQAVLQKFIGSNKYQGFDEEDLIHLLLKLELCYEEKVLGVVTRYFVPSALDDANGKALKGERQLEWPLVQLSEVDSKHIGRRLQCKDQLRTILGPGFFPRLQVRLRNRLFEKMGVKMKDEQYTNERNLIIFYTDGIEVLVESPHDIAYYVDILVRSHKTREQTIAFLMEHVVEEIQSFCASAQGSPGVTFIEGIIRPTCVSLLTLCTHRRSQVVLKEELISCIQDEEKKVMMDGEIFSWKGSFDYQHSWIAVPQVGLGGACERAQDLLDPGDLLEVLNKNERKVEQQLSSVDEAARVVLGPTHSNNHGRPAITTPGGQRHNKRPIYDRTMSDSAGPSHRTLFSSELRYGFEKLKGHLNNEFDDLRASQEQMDNKLEVILSLQHQTLQKVEDLRALQEHTLVTVLSKINQIMNLVQSDMPRRPYFTTKDVGKGRKLIAAIRIGKAVMLHFMCEGTGENLSHGVRGQVGYELIMEDAEWDGIRSIVVNSVRLMGFLAKAGLHVAAGIGGAIPNYVSWGGATAITGTALLGESLLNDLNSQLPGTSVEQSRCMEDEWWRLKEVLKKPLEGQMTKLFGLYRARFSRNSERGVAWVCDECLKRGKSKRILEPL